MKQVRVDKNQCQKIGKIVRTLKLRPEFHNRRFLKLKVEKEKIMLAYLFASIDPTYRLFWQPQVETNYY